MDKIKPVTLCCDIYHRDEKVGRLEIVDGKLIKNECYTDNLLKHPCSKSTNVLSILSILRNRVIPKHRCTEEMLKSMGLSEYNVYDVFKQNHGIDIDDFIWFKFDDKDKNITWEDVRVR